MVLKICLLNLFFVFYAENCTLSEWSDWTTCASFCAGEYRKRSRLVVQPAKNSGFCDDAVEQTDSCSVILCLSSMHSAHIFIT